MTQARVEIYVDPSQLASRVAAWTAEHINARPGVFRLALTGGSTPRALYRELAAHYRDSVGWGRVEFYWIDERFVPPDNPESNLRMSRETLLNHIPASPENIHPIPTGGDPDEAAAAYEATLKRTYGMNLLHPGRPLFDLVLLGLGSDGHICSLLPGSPALDEKERWVVAVKQGRPEIRITLTYPAVQSSRVTAFIVTGHDKAEAVRAARASDPSIPAGRLRPEGELVWHIDRAAAGL